MHTNYIYHCVPAFLALRCINASMSSTIPIAALSLLKHTYLSADCCILIYSYIFVCVDGDIDSKIFRTDLERNATYVAA
jgi:hypothetical protein